MIWIGMFCGGFINLVFCISFVEPILDARINYSISYTDGGSIIAQHFNALNTIGKQFYLHKILVIHAT